MGRGRNDDVARRFTLAGPLQLAEDGGDPARGPPPKRVQQYRKTTVWSQDKKPRTREDWMRAWKYIAPVFGHKNPNTVTLNMVAAFRDALRDSVSVREAHRVIKIWSRSRSRFHLCENEPCNSSAPSWRALGTAPDRKHLLVLSFTGFDPSATAASPWSSRSPGRILAPIARSALLPQGKNSIAGGCSPVPPSCAQARGTASPSVKHALQAAIATVPIIQRSTHSRKLRPTAISRP
jgi:hypothetical protein